MAPKSPRFLSLPAAPVLPFLLSGWTSSSAEVEKEDAVTVTGGSSSQSHVAVVEGGSDDRVVKKRVIRLGVPSKRMVDDTLRLLKRCQLSVERDNDRQYVAPISELSNLEVVFQRPKDIIEDLLSGSLDIGIVGLDAVLEHGHDTEDLIIVHNDLRYGNCRLSLAIPKNGIFENINLVSDLAQMPQWTQKKPLRVATGFAYLGPKFMKEKGLEHVDFSIRSGALEAAPVRGIADAILDVVSSGTTLRENKLKEIEGGVVLESQAVLVAGRKSLMEREDALDITRKILDRLEAHFCALGQVKVTAVMRGSSAEEVAQKVLSQPLLSGLQVPVRQVLCLRDKAVVTDCYAIDICVPVKEQFEFAEYLRAIGGSEVRISNLDYSFKEETPKWHERLSKLGIRGGHKPVPGQFSPGPSSSQDGPVW